MQARDVMTERLITVGLDVAVVDVAKLLLDKKISAVPVGDSEGGMVGMISEADLMHRAEIGAPVPKRWWLTMSQAELADAYLKTHGLKARDVMHKGVHSVSPNTDLIDVVSAMEKNGVKRMLVMEDGDLRGIVTRSVILRGFLAGRAAAEASQSDQAMRVTILDELRSQLWTTIAQNKVMVVDGVVSFWGYVSSVEERNALRAAVEGIFGVKRVEDHTVLMPGGPIYSGLKAPTRSLDSRILRG